MRTGAGLLNAFLCLLLVVGLHVLIVKPDAASRERKPVRGGGERRRAAPSSTSTMLSDLRRRRAKQQQRQQPSREYMEAWPPGPGDLADGLPEGAFAPPNQRPYTLEDEERAALHRLVFSQPDPSEYMEPSRPAMMPDYSGLHMAAETSITGDLPMHYIRPGAQSEDNTDHVSGMLSWGAGYQPVSA
eukprot:jgi/Tetstr1/464194/TSEL_008999.t1